LHKDDVFFLKEREKQKNILNAQKDRKKLPLRSRQGYYRVNIPSTA
jgi:hypothetical protein